MSEIIRLAPSATLVSTREVAAVLRTDVVYVVFTTIEDTLAAVRIADRLRRAMAVPLTLIHFRTIPYRMSVDAPSGLSPVETKTFTSQLQAEGFDVRVRVYLCRNEWRAIPLAFKQHSLIVVGGTDDGGGPYPSGGVESWKPLGTSLCSWTLQRTALQERKAVAHRRRTHLLDVLYLAIGAAGFIALWAITRAFDRV